MCEHSQLELDRISVEKFISNPAQRWSLIQKQVSTGIEKGIDAASRKYEAAVSEDERMDLLASALEKALKALMASQWQGRASLQSWSYRIGHNLFVDSLRRRNKNPLVKAIPLHASGNQDEAPIKATISQYSVQANHYSDPERQLMNCQTRARLSFLRVSIRDWPEPERSLAMNVLEGRANSLTASSQILSDQGHVMYASKAKQMLRAKLKDYAEYAYEI